MRLSERAELLSGIFDKSLGFTDSIDLLTWAAMELGFPNALDDWCAISSGKIRAVAPEKIYVVTASTLSVSALTVLVTGLLLGSRMVFKMPGGGLSEFEDAVKNLPPALSEKVELLPQHSQKIMQECDAVIVMGSDETVEAIYRETSWRQKFIPYGHKISCGILPMTNPSDARRWAVHAVRETLAYDQRGCLSPQCYLCTSQETAEIFAKELAEEFEKNAPKKTRSWEENAAIYLARMEAAAQGHRVYAVGEGNRWSVILQSDGAIISSGGGCTIRVVWVKDFAEALAPWQGWISAISIAQEGNLLAWGELAERVKASRVCQMGELQNPPISWRHDGMLRLGSLVRWIIVEGD